MMRLPGPSNVDGSAPAARCHRAPSVEVQIAALEPSAPTAISPGPPAMIFCIHWSPGPPSDPDAATRLQIGACPEVGPVDCVPLGPPEGPLATGPLPRERAQAAIAPATARTAMTPIT